VSPIPLPRQPPIDEQIEYFDMMMSSPMDLAPPKVKPADSRGADSTNTDPSDADPKCAEPQSAGRSSSGSPRAAHPPHPTGDPAVPTGSMVSVDPTCSRDCPAFATMAPRISACSPLVSDPPDSISGMKPHSTDDPVPGDTIQPIVDPNKTVELTLPVRRHALDRVFDGASLSVDVRRRALGLLACGDYGTDRNRLGGLRTGRVHAPSFARARTCSPDLWVEPSPARGPVLP
jgi:hypothetical protein